MRDVCAPLRIPALERLALVFDSKKQIDRQQLVDSFWFAWTAPSVPPAIVFMLLLSWAVFQHRITSLLQKRLKPSEYARNYLLVALDILVILIFVVAVAVNAGMVR